MINALIAYGFYPSDASFIASVSIMLLPFLAVRAFLGMVFGFLK
jgi:hypothetical protein